MTEPLVAKGVRYSFFILHELRLPLLFLVGLVLLGGGLFAVTMKLSYGAGCYAVFMLTLAEPTIEFPRAWYNQALFYLIPLLGLGAIADSLVRLGYLIFSSKRKLQEWWIMEASACRNHVVVCGLGRVGYRIVRELMALKEAVVVIERNRESALIEEILDADVPVIHGEIRLRKNLENANVEKARAIILATDDDLANLDAALTAREINPGIRVVMRLFDETLANKVASSFKLPALSTSQVAAPAFVAAATGRAVFHSFQLEGETIHLADLSVAKMASRSVAGLQKEFDVSVVYHKNARAGGWGPNPEAVLQTGDTIVVAAAMEKIQRLEAANRA